MEYFVNIIFHKNITLGKIEETVLTVANYGNVLLTEDNLEYEIFKEENSTGISVPLAKHIDENNIEKYVNKIANKLFDTGFDSFDIELSLNEAARLTTFEPWRAELEAAGYIITPSGTNVKTRDGSGTVAGINDNGNLWSGSETVTRIVRGNSSNTTSQSSAGQDRFGTFNADGTVAGPGQAARPGRRAEPDSTQPTDNDTGSENEPDNSPDDEMPNTDSSYIRNGDIVTGSDVDDSRFDWTLNIQERTVRFLNRTGQPLYSRVYISSSNGNERVAGTRDFNAVVLNNSLPNLINAIKEFVEDYDTRPGTPQAQDNQSPRAPSVQTDIQQPPTPDAGPAITITGDDERDIPALQQALGTPPTLNPPLDAGETSPTTGIRNPIRYSSNLVNGMPEIVNQSISIVGSDLTVRNAEAFRDTLNYDILTPEHATAIIRELDRLYPVREIAQAIRENDIPEDQKAALLVLLQVRSDLTDFLQNPQSADPEPPVDNDETNNVTPTGRQGDGGLSVARQARDITREIYGNLGNPITGLNTDEAAIQAALQSIETREFWNTVVGVYAQRYPQGRRRTLRTGTLLGDLRGAVSRRDWRRFIQPELDRLGIEEDYNGSGGNTNESIYKMKMDDVVSEETYDGNDFFEAYGVMWFNEDDELDEAEYQGRKVKLGKPMQGDVKKFKVYVRNPKGNVVKVNFGDPDMKIKKSNPARRRSFRARHNCDNPGPRHKARYWSCRKW